MKTLIALSKMWLDKNGTDVGFSIMSTKTKKVFNVLSRTTSGRQFVIQLIKDKSGAVVKNGEEYVVDGNNARYSFVGGSEAAKLEAQIAKLEAQRDNLESEISELEDQLSELDEVEDVG